MLPVSSLFSGLLSHDASGNGSGKLPMGCIMSKFVFIVLAVSSLI